MTVARQKDLFTKRWRQARAPDPSELQIQISLIQRLGYMALPNCVFFHVPNGELRDKRAAAKLKAMGTLPGVSDLVFIYNDAAGGLQVLFLELKARGRLPTPAQAGFADRVCKLGCNVEVADSIDRAVEILENYGIL
ncbi:MAG TPA: hypothetical protein VGH47_00080 [Xanthobacteraceae bacterium]|jgi:hypothetical protein